MFPLPLTSDSLLNKRDAESHAAMTNGLSRYCEIERIAYSYPLQYGFPIPPSMLADLSRPLLQATESITRIEEQLLTYQLLLQLAPRELTKEQITAYATLLDRFLERHLPTLRHLLKTSDITDNPTHTSLFTPAQRQILRQADLFPYLGPAGARIPLLLSPNP